MTGKKDNEKGLFDGTGDLMKTATNPDPKETKTATEKKSEEKPIEKTPEKPTPEAKAKEIHKIEKKKSQATVVRDEQYSGKVTAMIIEEAEIAELRKEDAGELSKKFIYRIKKGDDFIQGISISGARELPKYFQTKKAKSSNYNFIPKWRYEIQPLEGSKYLQKVYCENPKTTEETYGQAIFSTGDRFSERVALSIAKRNALLDQYPAEIKLQFIKYCIKSGYILPVQTAKVPELQTREDSQKTTATRAFFALIDSIVKKHGIPLDKDAVKDYYKKIAGAESFADLTIEQIREVWTSLQKIGIDKIKVEQLAGVLKKGGSNEK